MATWRSLILIPFLLGSAAWSAAPAPVEKPSLAFDGFKARGTLKGVKQWEAEAARAWMFRGTRSARAEVVAITYFQKGKAVSRAWADKADIDLKTYDIEAEGNVVVHGQNGVVLETERLSWNNQKEQVHTQAAVRVVRGRSVLTGLGLVADRRLEKVEVQEDVKVESASVKELRREKLEKP
jgi:LPS export ABC transporter protein LptC